MVEVGIVRPNSLARILLIARGERYGCSRFNSTARAIIACRCLRGCSSILAAATSQSGDLLLAISLYLPPQRGIGDPFPLAVGQRHFPPAQLLEVPSALSLW